MDRLTMVVCRALLQRTLDLFDLGDVAAIDAIGFDRVARQSAARSTNGLPLSGEEDDAVGRLPDRRYPRHALHDRPAPDREIGRQVLERNLDRLDTVMADKGYTRRIFVSCYG